mgnify:CR=1 FL=1
MKPRHKRMVLIMGGLLSLGLAAYFVLNAFQSNLVFFFTPSQVVAGEAPQGRVFRIGGMVETGTVKRDNLTVSFLVTDNVQVEDVHTVDLDFAYSDHNPMLMQVTLL